MGSDCAPVVIVGASLGGLRTAETLRRAGYDGEITLVGDEDHPPYMRPPLSKEALLGEVEHARIALPHRLAESVTWRLGTRVVAADLEARRVVTDAGEALPYSRLVIATGLQPRPVVPSTGEAQGVHRLRTLDDARRLGVALRPGARVVVAGAGFVGCEVAATARRRGCDVAVVGSQEVPMQTPLGAELGTRLRRVHEKHGVGFLMNSKVAGLVGTDVSTGVALTDGTVLQADVLVEAAGSVANTQWLVGQDLDLVGGVLTDSAMRALRRDGTPWPDVFAVGDLARFPHPLRDDRPGTIEHWNIPTETGRRAGTVIALTAAQAPELDDVVAQAFSPMPTFWSDQFDVQLLAFGILEGADEIVRLEQGDDIEGVFGYRRNGVLTGVCGLGMRSAVRRYRELIARDQRALVTAAAGVGR